jgi:CheY-like chemotaxis protein
MEPLAYKTILVVDDDDFVRHVIVSVLGRLGAWPVESASGQQALALLNNRKFDAALLDVLMPEMNGLAVLQAIRGGQTKADYALPVMLLTATQDAATLHFAKQLSCSGFLLKPVNPPELKARLAKLTGQTCVLPFPARHYNALDIGPPDKSPALPPAGLHPAF